MSNHVVLKGGHWIQVRHSLVRSIKHPQAYLLYSILLTYTNAKSNEAHPSRETLADHMGVKSVRSVDAALKVLVQLGLVSTFPRWRNEECNSFATQPDEQHKYQTSNGYMLYPDIDASRGRSSMPATGAEFSTRGAQQTAHKEEPVEEEPVKDKKHMSGSGEPDPCDGDLFAVAGTPAPAPQQQAPKPAPKLQRHTYTPEFEKFWKAYPTARGASKFETSERFAKALQYDTAENIIAGAERFADDPTRNPQYTPMPTTWLNKKRWTAEPDDVQQQVPQQPAQAPNPWAAYLDGQPTYPQEPRPDYAQGHTIIDDDWS